VKIKYFHAPHVVMPEISKFYSGRSVFVTGGSGFVGKQIVEKLMRSCPDIECIYLLMRPKRGHVTIESRLEQILQAPVS